MCGILVYASTAQTTESRISRSRFVKAHNLLKHRGPDAAGVWTKDDRVMMGHNRLSIVSVNTGCQPIVKDGIVLCVNGEIYNYQRLAKELHFDAANISDCESIIHIYKKYGPTAEALCKLDGMFSFVLYDATAELIWSARDPYGITSLYYMQSEDTLIMSSEMKAIASLEESQMIHEFKPGHMLTAKMSVDSPVFSSIGTAQPYHPAYLDKHIWQQQDMTYEESLKIVREQLTTAVKKRLMADVPSGVLLSGGLDSSLIASIMSRLKEVPITSIDNEKISFEDHRLQSFSVGLTGSPDHLAAQVVADYIGSHHHIIDFTIPDALDALESVIYHLETYDVTTIRASTPMFLLSRAIKARGIKMVLSGEGSDEIFGGYLYFHDAPNETEFKEECIQRVCDLHYFDCLRANKSTMAWGLEGRFPFLDKAFVDDAMQIPTKYKMCGNGKLEKQLLRDAFADYLPKEILLRQKEQFSDGVGYSWIDELKNFTTSQVSDEEFSGRATRFTYNTPSTKEAFYYRSIFETLFNGRQCEQTVKPWVPKREWGCNEDPSGRAQKTHQHKTQA